MCMHPSRCRENPRLFERCVPTGQCRSEVLVQVRRQIPMQLAIMAPALDRNLLDGL